ncbi:hypothetical protein SAMN05421820_107161 [Pedobacter steynii]|uniref:Chaperone of endosialidase n=1 Tax=Pedobacter steynii TaxID=430522 RepID=A0A1H0AP61_9SPHI|nr:hypothetical protein [Pedobacter steynii]NQX41297.1 hypothetical protein [Pedobacter steynii]SDN35352.1 hypothetical protein SAMN05421820_107161 [Pedobacter steynii]
MVKKLMLSGVCGFFLCIQAQSQDAVYNNLNVERLTKGGGSAEFSGWGLNSNPAVDVRPNPSNRFPFVMNNHDGLTFSAHSMYGGIRFYNQGYPLGPLELSTGAKMVMSITNNNVGIGTTNPRVLLDVGEDISSQKLGAVFGRLPEGDGTGEGTFLGVRGFGTQLANYEGKSFSLEHSFYGTVNSSINFFRGLGTEGGFLAFNTDKNLERMRIDVNGNIGIGTPSPREKLSVNGNIRAREVKVEAGNWPDYVFAKDYKMESLKELEAYILKHQHLPEIPSAKEVEKEGISLGVMNKLLLQKIEELTLHLIEKDKALSLQNEKIQLQEIRMDKLEKMLKQHHKN